jgi:hypothetical protein
MYSPCDMNLPASQHSKMSLWRKRLFINVQYYVPGFPRKTKRRITHPEYKLGVIMAGLKIQLALCKGFERHLVILLVTLKY